MEKQKIMKILVLRFSSIGDIVLTTPVIRCIKNQLNAEVHYLTKSSFSSILSYNPNIDKLWIFEHSVNELIDRLRAENFDFIVDLHNNIRTLKLKSKLKVKSKAFPKLNVQKWLYVNFKMDIMPDIHVVDRYFEAVRSLGVKNDNQGLDYFIGIKDEVVVQEILPSNFHHGYAALTLGAQFKTKCLPKEKMLELLDQINTPVVLLGGKDDAELGDSLAANFPETVFNLAGELNLSQSASILKQAHVVIAHDTGLMHIASAFHKPIAVVWGNTTPKIGMSPYQVDAPVKHFEVEKLSCRPCSKIGFQKCPKKHFKCMINQDIDSMVKFVESNFRQKVK